LSMMIEKEINSDHFITGPANAIQAT